MQHQTPALDDFTSVTLVSRRGDRFNPPALTNFLGAAQAAQCVVGLQHLTFPPFSHGDTVIGRLTINDTCVGLADVPISFVWRPDRISRTCRIGDLHIESRTMMGVDEQAVYIDLDITNTGSASAAVSLSLLSGAGVVRSDKGWGTPYSPKEGPSISVTPWEGSPLPHSLVRNERHILCDGAGILYSSRTSTAFSLQAVVPNPIRIEDGRMHVEMVVPSDGTRIVHFMVAVGDNRPALDRIYEKWSSDPLSYNKKAERDWEKEVAAVFTPGNDRYSGHLPVLVTTNDALRRIYLTAIIGIVYLKREHPLSSYGRTYTTLMPRYWVTTSFINDWSLSAYLLAMLDPDCVRDTIERWLGRDVHSHFGTEYVSGASAGNWYSCNDFAIVRLATAYIRVTGDTAWLNSSVSGRSMLQHVVELATHYRSLVGNSRLADYGDRNSLLEAVGSYTHEVVSLNAANIWMLREAATLLEYFGDQERAGELREEADGLLPDLLSLYVDGAGYWNCRQPDGSLVAVRHAWDFVHVMTLIGNDVGPRRRAEMIDFFGRELMTPAWMAALSPRDDDVDFSLRPDHQWNGSYPGWVALATRALFAAGRDDMLAEWLPGLAASGEQGPYAQAHFVESYAAPLSNGGAVKAPTEWPYINDWAILCVGGFFELVLLDLFGLSADYMAPGSNPRLENVDADARLLNVNVAGRLYTLDRNGMHEHLDAV